MHISVDLQNPVVASLCHRLCLAQNFRHFYPTFSYITDAIYAYLGIAILSYYIMMFWAYLFDVVSEEILQVCLFIYFTTCAHRRQTNQCLFWLYLVPLERSHFYFKTTFDLHRNLDESSTDATIDVTWCGNWWQSSRIFIKL